MAVQRHSEPPTSKAGARAREVLIEAAGREFAAKGLHGATSRQICLDAGVNLAAVNYHFGGFDALYVATLAEAHRRAIGASLPDPADLAGLAPHAKLRAFLRAILSRVALPIAGSWEIRLISLEMAAPTFAHKEFIAMSMEPQRLWLRQTLGEFLDRAPDDALVGRCLVSVLAPFVALAVIDRQALEAYLPDIASGDGVDNLVGHIERFVMAGLEGVRRDAGGPTEGPVTGSTST